MQRPTSPHAAANALLAALRFVLAGALGAGCSGAERSLRVGGATPFVRCLAADAPRARELRLGRGTLRVEGRSLMIDGLSPSPRLAAFSGPAFHAPPGRAELDALRAANPEVLLLLGDLGDDAGRARATLSALASLPAPLLVLAGGRDTLERVADAVESVSDGRDHIFDITPLSRVRIGDHELVPLAGAYEGRYALGDDGCGYGRADVSLRARPEGATAAPRSHLLAWEQPPGWPVAPLDATPEEPPAPEFAELAARATGIFAWPAAALPSARSALRPGQGLVVPRLTGPAQELDDGSRLAPGFVRLRLDPNGLVVDDI